MNLNNFKTDWNKPTIITAQQYGTKVSVELDHSDTSLDELMDAFKTLAVGLGYHSDTWKGWILDRAADYQEEENEKWDEDGGFGQPYTIDDFKRDEEEAVRSIIKTKMDAKIFSDALENPPAPNEKLKEAVDEFRKEIKKQKFKK
jgi:hypothetical protein